MLFRDIFVLLIIVIASCHSGSDSSAPTAIEPRVLVAMPTAKSTQQLLQEGTWRAFINVSGAKDLTCDVSIDVNTCELSVDTAAEKGSTRIDLAAGTYELRIVWEYRDPIFRNLSRSDGFWLIADAQKQLTVEAGKTSSLDFSENDYKPLPDDDGDGVSNLMELANRSDPNDPNDPQPNVVVPDVVGLEELEARKQIEAAGLVVGSVSLEFSNSVKADRVISQNPMRDVLVRPGASVDLVVSKGQPPIRDVPVPDCRNVPEEDCKEFIKAAELKVGKIIRKFSNVISAGNVIRTVPRQDTMVENGSSVNLVVSRGPSDDDDDDDD